MKLSKVYEPAAYETEVYKLWETAGAFQPNDTGKPFTIVMPPPNANANLHVGHVLGSSIQDILIRYHRMIGDASLWIPGADHAGFETWVVYEKKLAEQGLSRFAFTREELYSQVWDFVQENKTNFESQLRALGASCDWSRFTFTLDDKVVKTAYSSFKRMWDDGLIYRGERIVNFCTTHGTSFSDYEVVYRDEKSHLWHINFPLADGSGHITVATTRPETMVGDVAVAVNPSDKRFAKLVGKNVTLPLADREIPIIADDMVDMKFGTGAVKITPAHDPNDFDVVERHDLPRFSVIDYEGNMNENAPEAYQGLSVLEARVKIVSDLTELGLLEKEEAYTHSVGHCYKCDTVIQPLLKDQWFVRMQPLAKQAIEAIKKDEVTFTPASKKRMVLDYLQGIKDWNISRQIAWGIPIPAFRNAEDPDDWIFDERVDHEFIEVGGKVYHRDPDVFDTWFSSDQWPYITSGYPLDADYERFYPTTLMETGGEILYVWVTRMIMMGLYVTGKVPFSEVYIHGNVKASDGTKMSKSKGNTINPMDVIKEYGSDAVRIGIISGRTAGAHQAYTPAKVVGGRNFCNKLWNIARYIEGVLGEDFIYKRSNTAITPADHWILHKLGEASSQIATYLENYQFSLALERVHELVWNELADWYIESSKQDENKQLLAYVLEATLKLTHPFAPFVTETIWQTLAWEKDSLLISSQWPNVTGADSSQASEFEEVKQLITDIRQLISTSGIRDGTLLYKPAHIIDANSALILRLSGLGELTPSDDLSGLRLTSSSVTAFLEVTSDQLREYEAQKAQEIESLKKQIASLQKRLANSSYVDNAPVEVVNETRSQLQEAETALARLVSDTK